MKSKIELSIQDSQLAIVIAKIAIAVHKQTGTPDKMLEYMVKYSTPVGKSYAYKARRGSRAVCCKRLKITPKQYRVAIQDLVDTGVVQRRENGVGSSFLYYELSNFLCTLKKKYLVDK